MTELKQVIVMRKDLNMRAGKMIVQGAHATSLSAIGLHFQKSLDFQQWVANGQKKVCVYVDSEVALDKIVEMAREKSLPCFVVTDAGHTEFHGVPTVTCCAIGPAPSILIDTITGHLPLL